MRMFTRIGIRIIPVVTSAHPHIRIIPPAVHRVTTSPCNDFTVTSSLCDGNSLPSLDKLRHTRSIAYLELVLLNKHQISSGGAYLDCYA